VANAVAAAYLTRSRQVEQGQVSAARARLARELLRLRTTPGGAAQTPAIQERLSELTVNEASAGSELQLAQAARPPTAAYSPRPLRNTLFAFFGAVFVAVFVVFAREHFAPRIGGRALGHLLGVPVLAGVPVSAATPPSNVRRRGRVADRDGRDFFAALRIALELQLPSGAQHSLLVAGGAYGQGSAGVAAGLARALAAAGYRTVLVDGDVRNPAVHEFVDRAPGSSLRDAFALLATPKTNGDGKSDVAEALDRARVDDRLWALVGPGEHDDGATLPSMETVEALFDELRRRDFDYAIVAGPPLSGLDGQMLARFTDFTLVVGRPDRLRSEDAHDLRALIQLHGSDVLGLVVVGDSASVSTRLPGPLPHNADGRRAAAAGSARGGQRRRG
jgi:Mrp family chromosome partitioning ATPase